MYLSSFIRHFVQVCLFLHDLRHDFDQAIDCYLCDSELRDAKGVFEYIAGLKEKVMTRDERENLTVRRSNFCSSCFTENIFYALLAMLLKMW